jgi:hypothetical protein
VLAPEVCDKPSRVIGDPGLAGQVALDLFEDVPGQDEYRTASVKRP